MLQSLSLAFLCRCDTLHWGEFPGSPPSLLAVALPGYSDLQSMKVDPEKGAIVAMRGTGLGSGASSHSREQWIGDG